MLRTAILRSAAAVSRTAMRPIPSAAARRIAIAPAPRATSFVPKTVAWQAVRCYASGSSLDKGEVYTRIKELLSGFDKVRSALPFHLPAGSLARLGGLLRSYLHEHGHLLLSSLLHLCHLMDMQYKMTRLTWLSLQVNDPSNVSVNRNYPDPIGIGTPSAPSVRNLT